MDVSTASSINLYNYRTATSGTAGVLGVLAQTYQNASAALTSMKDPAALAGAQGLAPLVTAIYDLGGQKAAIPGLDATTVGGLNSGSASDLLGSLIGANASDFLSALQGPAALATAGALARQAYGSGTVAQEARSQAEAGAEAAGTSSSTPSAAYLLQAAAAAQQATLNNTFTLLA